MDKSLAEEILDGVLWLANWARLYLLLAAFGTVAVAVWATMNGQNPADSLTVTTLAVITAALAALALLLAGGAALYTRHHA